MLLGDRLGRRRRRWLGRPFIGWRLDRLYTFARQRFRGRLVGVCPLGYLSLALRPVCICTALHVVGRILCLRALRILTCFWDFDR